MSTFRNGESAYVTFRYSIRDSFPGGGSMAGRKNDLQVVFQQLPLLSITPVASDPNGYAHYVRRGFVPGFIDSL